MDEGNGEEEETGTRTKRKTQNGNERRSTNYGRTKKHDIDIEASK